MDSNSDGYVDRHELKSWILRSFKSLAEEEANERFDDVDENEDGKVTWEEYVKDTYGMDSSDEDMQNNIVDLPPQRHTEEEAKIMADDKIVFAASDLNSDGHLTPHEFVMFISPEEYPQMLPVLLKQTLRDKDKNNDGKIDFQEFVGESGKHHDKEWLVTEKDKFDEEFDKDKDGFLNGNEILSWIVPSNELSQKSSLNFHLNNFRLTKKNFSFCISSEVATDEVDHLYVAADDDHDDRLSYTEIVNNYDIFVGSEATDYGDHLQKIHHFDDEL